MKQKKLLVTRNNIEAEEKPDLPGEYIGPIKKVMITDKQGNPVTPFTPSEESIPNLDDIIGEEPLVKKTAKLKKRLKQLPGYDDDGGMSIYTMMIKMHGNKKGKPQNNNKMRAMMEYLNQLFGGK